MGSSRFFILLADSSPVLLRVLRVQMIYPIVFGTLILFQIAVAKMEISGAALRGKIPEFIHQSGDSMFEEPNASPDGYFSTGWVSQLYYTAYDTTCNGDPYYITGIPAATCLPYGGGSYKYLLTQDSCVGGTAQYFSDSDCTVFTHSQNLPSTTCTIFGQQSYRYACTTSSQPLVVTEAAIQMSYSSDFCTGTIAYTAYTVPWCSVQGDSTYGTFQCNGDSLDFASYPYTDTECSGQPTSTTNYPSGCTVQAYNDQNSVKWYCGSATGGGGSDDVVNDDYTSTSSGELHITFLTIIIIVVVVLACGGVAACVGCYFCCVYSRGLSDGTTLSVSANGQPMVNPLTAELPVYNNHTDGVVQEMVPNTNA